MIRPALVVGTAYAAEIVTARSQNVQGKLHMVPKTAGGPAEMLVARDAVGQYTRWPQERQGFAGGRRVNGESGSTVTCDEGVTFTIITVTFNAAETVRQCLESVHRQDYPHVEHIVVDGGSTDGTLEVVNEFDNDLEYWISESDTGIYDAMNKGLLLAHGDVVGVLNADDYYLDGALTTVARYFKRSRADYVFGAVNKGGRIKHGLYPEKRYRNLQFFPGHSSAAFFRLSVHKRIGLYPTTFECSADRYLIYRMIEDPSLSGCATAEDEVVGYFREDGYSSRRTERQRASEEYRIRVATGTGRIRALVRSLINATYRLRAKLSGWIRRSVPLVRGGAR